MTETVQAAFLDQVLRLPEPSRHLLLVAAAEDTGDRHVVLRAASALGCRLTDLVPAETAGLVRVNHDTVRFRHPLVRSAVYQAAPVSLRLVVHTGAERPAGRRAQRLRRSRGGLRTSRAAHPVRSGTRPQARAGRRSGRRGG